MDAVNLKLAIKAVWDVLMTSGVYPAAFIECDKEGKETKRTERTEGVSDELALLMIADVGYMQDGKFTLNMNDTFYYGADCEELSNEEEIKEAAKLFGKYGYGGLTYWVAQKRGYDPEVTRYRDKVREIRRKERV